MGNCICVTHKTTTSLSGGDYGSCNNKRKRRSRSTVHHYDAEDEENLLGETSCVSSSSCGRREIKIRMTKKEHEDFMRNISLKDMSAEEILSMLLSDGGDQTGSSTGYLDNHHRPWKPALQSIPEID